MVAYFVYSNGTALTSNEVEKMLSDPDHYLALTNLGLMYIVSSNSFKDSFSVSVGLFSVILYFLYKPLLICL